MTPLTSRTPTMAPISGVAHRVTFGVLAVVLVALELLSRWGGSTPNTPTSVWLVVGYGLLALTGWVPLVGGTLYTVATLVAIVAPDDVLVLGFAMIGVFAVAGEWISRGWYAAAGLIMALSATVDAIHSGYPSVSLIGFLLGAVVSVTLGLSLRWNHNRVAQLEDQATSARHTAESAQLDVRREIAATLHDTLVEDLVRLIVGTQALTRTTTDPLAAEDSRALTETARQAMVHLRALMSSALPDQSGRPDPVGEVVATCQKMLAGREITLAAALPPDLEACLGTRQRDVLALVIREGSTNILKFARAGSRATLTIDTPHEGGAAVSLVNDIDPVNEQAHASLSGGFGLDNVSARVAAEGGTVQYGSRGATWVLTAMIPVAVGSPLPLPGVPAPGDASTSGGPTQERDRLDPPEP